MSAGSRLERIVPGARRLLWGFTRTHGIAIARIVSVLALAAPAAAGSLGGPNWTSVPLDAIDPQIAAGPDHVLITQYNRVYYYDKAGNRITHVGDDVTKALLLESLEDLFQPIRTHVNSNLRLPAGATCNLSHQRDDVYYILDPAGPQVVLNYCLTRFGYDARVLYDEYRQRFVIVAVAFNPTAKCKFNTDANYKARRTKILVAYSASSDPTDGQPWRLTWFDAVPGETCETNECREYWEWQAGSAADYPIVAIAKDHLLVSMKNALHEKLPSCPDDPDYEDEFDDLTATVHVWNTKALATRNFDEATCNGICAWVYHGRNLRYPDGSPVKGSVTVGRGHGDPYLGDAWFANKDGADKLNLWHFSIGGTSTRPQLHPLSVPVLAFDDLEVGDNSYGGPGHAKLKINGTTSLIQKGSHLYYADVGGMRHGGTLDASIRLLELKGNASGTAFPLGRNAIFHGAGVGFGSPAIEVNGGGDITMVYRKIGEGFGNGMGARFLVWPAGSADKPEGEPLARDEANFPCTQSPCERRGDFDTAGISRAPGGRIYVMQPYIKANKTWGYAVNYILP